MLTGALILLAGMAIGYAICRLTYKPKTVIVQTEKPPEIEKPYDKYRNGEGLLSRKAVKSAKEGR